MAGEAAPPRKRRRATRPAAAPEAVAEPVAVPAEPAESEEPAPRKRRRATRAESGTETAAPAQAATQETEQTEEPAAPRTRRRATRAASAPDSTAASESARGTDAAEETAAPRRSRQATRSAAAEPSRDRGVSQGGDGARAVEADLSGSEEDAAAPRRRRRAVRAAAPIDEGKARGSVTEDRAGSASEPQPPAVPVPATAVFQPPVFQAPMFQTPERAAAEAAALAEAEAEPDEAELVEETDDAELAEENERPSRRRRRGGRRRRRGESAERASETDTDGDSDSRPGTEAETAAEDVPAEPAAEAAEAAEEQESAEDAQGEGSGSGSSRRRRRRRRRSEDSGEGGATGTDDPERTVIKVREPRKKKDEPTEAGDGVQSIKGSTRLEAKKQRRREGREQGRRRVPIITEAEFLARREAVERVMVVRQQGDRTQIGVLEDNVLVEHFVNKEQSSSYVGNVYLGKVQNVLPSMEAAFVDIGKGRNAVLYAGEVNFESLGLGNGPRRIESALKSGQPVLVQVTKDPIGHKGARLTSQISLPGRYLVYVPEGSMTGISRKLPDTERARLKQILKKILPEDAGVIVRTAAEGASEEELTRDVERLQAQWEEIQKRAKKGNAPTLLYGEPDMTVRVVRDIFNEDFSKVIVSGDEAWNTIHGYVSQVAPDLSERLQRWTSEVDVFATYRIDEQLMKALDRKVWLPSGGSLVIDRTEAMVVIDVNTGRFTGQGGNLEETVTRNNLEAAEEIVRQLRLRDLGGIIVIDFIDMVLESNRDLVLRRLLECLGRDRTKHQVAEVTSLGLVQMTRKRVGQGLLESFSEPCVHCNGRGVIVHMEQPHTHAGAGGGKKGKGGKAGRKEKAAAAPAPEVGAAPVPEPVAEPEAVPAPLPEAGEETRPEVVPVSEPATVITPDEELYGSVAEAEEAARRGPRGRRRAGRRAGAPAGSPKPVAAAEEEAVTVVPATEAAPEPVAPAEPAPAAEEPAPRRRTRKASAPAGSPKPAAEEPPALVVVPSEPVAGAEEPAPREPAPAPVAEEPAPRRRRVVRRVSAPAGSPEGGAEAAVTVIASSERPEAERPEAGPKAPEAGQEAPEQEAPAKKTARKTAAKKSTAKKSTAKKATAKKTAAKKTATAKKTAAKKSGTAKKSTAKKTAAAEQQAPPSVSASAED
ncbi:Rne/Rng family ribonuclease [Streptomyces harbinensis]|uniref:Rne/Rng family ribonuclease n=1 Tax=Streptomyces harbinensis TaxID=1176198 RepID=UPI001FE29CA5|nr:Rne/Rng family ribonuclease [Streptomyces harbinensis]